MSTLFLVGTPIGNLEDITLRALHTLREAPLVAAEDTREARKLLHRYEIDVPVIPYHAESPPAHLRRVLAALEEGDVAYVSDAGMPGVSDPGAELVRAAVEVGHQVTPIPGVSAVTAAVAGAGISAAGFVFAGFLPRKVGDRRRELRRLATLELPIVVFESPHRVAALLNDIAAELPTAQVVISRELTKLHEQWQRGTAAELAGDLREQGEFTIVIAPGQSATDQHFSDAEIDALLRDSLANVGSVRDAVAEVADATGLGRRALYQRALALQKLPDEDG